MNSLLPVLSLITVAVFFAVLCGLVLRIAAVIGTAADQLGSASVAVRQMRAECAAITPAVEGMNQNLYTVAAQLMELGDAAEAISAGPN